MGTKRTQVQVIVTFCSNCPGGFLFTTHEEVPETLPNALRFQLSPGAPRIQGGPVFPPAHQGRGRTVDLAGQYGCLVHGGVHCSWSRLNGGHRWRGAQRERVLGACRSAGGGRGDWGRAHSLWISTRKATLVLPAGLRAVQL